VKAAVPLRTKGGKTGHFFCDLLVLQQNGSALILYSSGQPVSKCSLSFIESSYLVGATTNSNEDNENEPAATMREEEIASKQARITSIATDEIGSKVLVKDIRDAVHGKFTLELSTNVEGEIQLNGESQQGSSLFRASLLDKPSSGLVQRCLLALRKRLPRDLAVHLCSDFVNHSTSPSLAHHHQPTTSALNSSSDSEWSSFVVLIHLLLLLSTNNNCNSSSESTTTAMASTAEEPSAADGNPRTKKSKHGLDVSTGNNNVAMDEEETEDAAWNFLLSSQYHISYSKSVFLQNLSSPTEPVQPSLDYTSPILASGSSSSSSTEHNRPQQLPSTHLTSSNPPPLSSTPHAPSVAMVTPPELFLENIDRVLMTLHFVYEDLKLNVLTWKLLPSLASFLLHLSTELGATDFVDYYSRDFGDLATSNTGASVQQIVNSASEVREEPFNVHRLLLGIIDSPSSHEKNTQRENAAFGKAQWKESPMPLTRKICVFYSTLFGSLGGVDERESDQLYRYRCEKLVLRMVEEMFYHKDLDVLPFGVALPIRQALRYLRYHPPPDWPSEAYILLARDDLACSAPPADRLMMKKQRRKKNSGAFSTSLFLTERNDVTTSLPPLKKSSMGTEAVGASKGSENAATSKSFEDGTEIMNDEISSLRFRRDARLRDAQRILKTSQPLIVKIKGSQGMSDSDVVAEQLSRLSHLAQRQMASSIGRGMLTIASYSPLLTEPITIPPLILSGKLAQSNSSLSLDTLTPDLLSWPEFHNGMPF